MISLSWHVCQPHPSLPCTRGATMCHLAHSTHVDAYVHTTVYGHIHAYAPKIDEHVHLTGSSPCTMYHLLMNTFPTLLLMCTYMLVHLHVAFSFFYCLLIQVHEKKKEKKGGFSSLLLAPLRRISESQAISDAAGRTLSQLSYAAFTHHHTGNGPESILLVGAHYAPRLCFGRSRA